MVFQRKQTANNREQLGLKNTVFYEYTGALFLVSGFDV